MIEAPHGPLILTALLDPASQARFERERQQHFPPSLNIVPAHVTLFHHLPPEHHASILQTLAEASVGQGPAPFTTTGVRFLGRGSAYTLQMPTIAALRARLAAAWQPWLTAQDRQPWHAHVTVQNKVPPDAAKRLYANLAACHVPHQGTVRGIELWEYLGGPWQWLQTTPFTPPS